MNRLLELSVLDGLIRYMRELRDHHTHDDTQELANDGDRNGEGQCRFRGGTGKNRKRSGDDTSELHVWWSGCSDRYKSHGNKFQGCT